MSSDTFAGPHDSGRAADIGPLDREIAIVGCGQVGRAIVRSLANAGAKRLLVTSRDPADAAAVAAIVPFVTAVGADIVPRRARHIIIAVQDRHIHDVARTLARAGMSRGIVVHTSGALGLAPLNVLIEAGVKCGVLHPFQTITRARESSEQLKDIAFGVAGHADAVDWASDIISALGGWALRVEEQYLNTYHSAAVMAGNMMVAAVHAASGLLVKAGVPPHLVAGVIGPLAYTSLQSALSFGPDAALTGPVARGDVPTIQGHLKALVDVPPSIRALYIALSLCLLDLARTRRLTADQVQALTDVLALEREAGRTPATDRGSAS